MNQDLQNAFISLVRLGIGHMPGPFPEQIDWNSIETLSGQHGLLAAVVDGIERLPEQQRPPKTLLLEWIGNTLQSYEQRYSLYEKAIGKLAGFYNQHGYKMMLLKGYACSLDWAFFVEKHTKEIDWDWLLELLDKYHMREFFNCINAICVEDLGFSATMFPYVQYLPDLKQKVLSDILEPEYTAEEPKGFVRSKHPTPF